MNVSHKEENDFEGWHRRVLAYLSMWSPNAPKPMHDNELLSKMYDEGAKFDTAARAYAKSVGDNIEDG